MKDRATREVKPKWLGPSVGWRGAGLCATRWVVRLTDGLGADLDVSAGGIIHRREVDRPVGAGEVARTADRQVGAHLTREPFARAPARAEAHAGVPGRFRVPHHCEPRARDRGSPEPDVERSRGLAREGGALQVAHLIHAAITEVHVQDARVRPPGHLVQGDVDLQVDGHDGRLGAERDLDHLGVAGRLCDRAERDRAAARQRSSAVDARTSVGGGDADLDRVPAADGRAAREGSCDETTNQTTRPHHGLRPPGLGASAHNLHANGRSCNKKKLFLSTYVGLFP